jgi:hypothetical protein
MANVLAGGRQSDLSFDVTRTDGKPLQIQRLHSSQPWIVARIDPTDKAGDGAARIRVEVQGVGAPRRFNEFIHVFAEGQTETPIANVSVFGEIKGELTVSPAKLFWALTGFCGQTASQSPYTACNDPILDGSSF